jgi:ribosomal 30S subunit maturation factor RimM
MLCDLLNLECHDKHAIGTLKNILETICQEYSHIYPRKEKLIPKIHSLVKKIIAAKPNY